VRTAMQTVCMNWSTGREGTQRRAHRRRTAARRRAARDRRPLHHQRTVLESRRGIASGRCAGVPPQHRRLPSHPLHRAGRRLRGVGVPGPRDKQLPAGFAAAAMAFNPGHRTQSRTGRSVARAECGRGVPADCRGRLLKRSAGLRAEGSRRSGFPEWPPTYIIRYRNGLEAGQRPLH
jgi:hypothetical protein